MPSTGPRKGCLLTALVAVVEREGDMSGEVPRTTIVPVGMPQGVLFGSYFGAQKGPCCAAPRSSRARSSHPPRLSQESISIQESTEDLLLELAATIEPVGGLPGDSEEDRLIATLTALLLFAAEGHTLQRGAFAPHVRRLVSYLETADLSALSSERKEAVTGAVETLKRSGTVCGDWLPLARSYLETGGVSHRRFWRELSKA